MSRRLPQAIDVRDESTDVVRVVVEIKPDASPEAVMAYVFKHTSLQINFNVNLIKDGIERVVNDLRE